MIRSLYVIILTFAYILVTGPPMLLIAWIAKRGDWVFRVGRVGTRLAVWLAGVKKEVRGRENIPAGQAVVFMANHQSNCDPPALISSLPALIVMVKKEFFKVPILGRSMLACGFIPVERKAREAALQAIEKAVESIRAGHSILVFPEGTRSPDGRLQKFKKGVFVMAMEAGAPIVPVSISGSRKIMRKGESAMHPGTVRITIHPPVATQGCNAEDRPRIMYEVRKAILSGLAEEEQPLQAEQVDGADMRACRTDIGS
jgi:1-acyl-sn-glycerol-3-phosphate acyltransferase